MNQINKGQLFKGCDILYKFKEKIKRMEKLYHTNNNQKRVGRPGTVVHASNTSTLEAEGGGSL